MMTSVVVSSFLSCRRPGTSVKNTVHTQLSTFIVNSKTKFSALKGEIDQQEKLIKNGLKKHERVFSVPVVCLYLLDENIQTCLMRNCSILLWLRLYLLPSIKHSHFHIPAGTSTLRHKRIYKTFGSDWIDVDETYIWRPSSQTHWEFLLEMSAS